MMLVLHHLLLPFPLFGKWSRSLLGMCRMFNLKVSRLYTKCNFHKWECHALSSFHTRIVLLENYTVRTAGSIKGWFLKVLRSSLTHRRYSYHRQASGSTSLGGSKQFLSSRDRIWVKVRLFTNGYDPVVSSLAIIVTVFCQFKSSTLERNQSDLKSLTWLLYGIQNGYIQEISSMDWIGRHDGRHLLVPNCHIVLAPSKPHLQVVILRIVSQ